MWSSENCRVRVEGAALVEASLPRRTLVVQSRAALHAAAKLSRIEHGLPDHLEDFGLKDMRRDNGVPTAFDLRSVVVVLSRAAIAAVRGLMIHGHVPRGAHDLLPPSKGRAPASAHSALNEAAEKVVRGGLAAGEVRHDHFRRGAGQGFQRLHGQSQAGW
jgi:hypothetical protein